MPIFVPKTVESIIAPVQAIHDKLLQHADQKTSEAISHDAAIIEYTSKKTSAAKEANSARNMADRFAGLLGLATSNASKPKV